MHLSGSQALRREAKCRGVQTCDMAALEAPGPVFPGAGVLSLGQVPGFWAFQPFVELFHLPWTGGPKMLGVGLGRGGVAPTPVGPCVSGAMLPVAPRVFVSVGCIVDCARGAPVRTGSFCESEPACSVLQSRGGGVSRLGGLCRGRGDGRVGRMARVSAGQPSWHPAHRAALRALAGPPVSWGLMTRLPLRPQLRTFPQCHLLVPSHCLC